MKLEVSYNLMYTDWYVGALYENFFIYLKENNPDIEFEFTHLNSYSEKFEERIKEVNINSNYPSVFNPYNLIIRNPTNNKTFIHSFNDFAPVILEDGTGIEIFDVVKFACSSSLTKSSIEQHSEKYKIQPSVYLLEHISEHKLINELRKKNKKIKKIFFNGACYGERGIYKNILEKSKKFVFKDKSLPVNYKDRENYYKEISDYKYGLSLNGAAKICYRDLEYFGMGILNFRKSLDILTYEPIVENEHYFKIIDDDIKRRLYDKNEESYILDKINYNFKSIIKNNDTNKVVENSLEWFEKNCLPENQIKILYSFLENFKIFE